MRLPAGRGALIGAAVAITTALAHAQHAPARGPMGRDASASRPYVVLVSFDAFRHDYLDRFRPPAFLELARRGVRARALIPSFPSKTFPNHLTLVTGLSPGRNGIVGNTFYDPVRDEWYRSGQEQSVADGSWYSGDPIWVTAERNGVKTGVFFWPGSEAAIAGVRPTYVTTYDKTVTNATRVDSAITWLRKPDTDRPHLVLLYFSDVDDTTHRYGPDAAQTAVAVASVDRTLRRLLDSLHALPFGNSVNVVLVSDHGMTFVDSTHVIPVGNLLTRGGVDTVGVRVSDNGPTTSLWFGADSVRLRASRKALDAPRRHVRAYLRAEAPARWHVRDNVRFGDLLVVADKGYFLVRRSTDAGPSPGQHGYDPQVPDMQGIFVAAGSGVKPGVIPALENVNVYPFLAALLKLEHVPHTDGDLKVLSRVLR